MDHVTEEELVIFAVDPDAISRERGAAIERHLAACGECRMTYEFFVVGDHDLGDTDTWEPTSGSETLRALRGHAARIAEEDREAEELLRAYLKAPAKVAWTDIHTRRRFRTGGVARRLSAHANALCGSEPLDALIFAESAVGVSEALPDDTYPANAVFEIRGTAWKERANALIRLGRAVEALDSCLRAERAYRRLRSNALGLASVALVRASALYQLQRLDEAAASAAIAEKGFGHLGETDRQMRCLYLRASIRYEAGDLPAAATLFGEIVRHGESVGDILWIAKGAYAIGNCALDRGDLGEASLEFSRALAIFREEAPESADRVSADWGLARVFLHAGKWDDAGKALQRVSSEFEKRGMVTDAALAGLDEAEVLLARGEYRSIVELAGRLFRVFTEAEMLTGALTALAYLKDAAAAGILTTESLRAVRIFVARVEREPTLLFLPPPE